MTLLRQIQEDAVSGKVSIGDVLRRCKVLAARLDSAPLQEWIRHESEGYPAAAELPSYRMLPMRLLGHFCGPFGREIRNAPIPLMNIPEEVRPFCTEFECRESVSAIEDTLSGERANLSVPIPPDAVRFFSDRVYEHMNCISAWGALSPSGLVAIIDHVRNKVLDFALSIEKLDAQAGEGTPGTSPLPPAQVTNIFNTTILGGAVGAVGDVKATNITASNVSKGDLGSLRTALSAQRVDDTDIDELEGALRSEPKVQSDESFGPKVQGWIGKMIGKADSGAWNIALGAAGTLLAGAIRAFYGLPS